MFVRTSAAGQIMSEAQVDVHLRGYGFDPSDPLRIYHAVKDVFERACSKSLKYWETHYPFFLEGRVGIAKGDTNTALAMTCVMKKALSAPQVSFQEKVAFLKGMTIIFQAHKWKLHEVPAAKIRLIEEETHRCSEITVSLSFCNRIPYIREALKAGGVESMLWQRGEAFEMTLPAGTTIETFDDLMQCNRDPSNIRNLSWGKALAVFCLANYLTDERTVSECLNNMMHIPAPSLEEMADLLGKHDHLHDIEIANQFFSFMLSSYIRFYIKDGRDMEDISTELSAMREFRDHIEKFSIDLYLENCPIDEKDLLCLDLILPDVRSLDISRTEVKELPLLWAGTLRSLNISNTAIAAIPQGFSVLEKFLAKEALYLHDISGLNGLLRLTYIDVSESAVDSLPSGCNSLEVLRANGAADLEDISALNGLPSLKELHIGDTFIRQAPQGCQSLEIFYASDAIWLTDLSGLNGSLLLKTVDISGTGVTSAPHNCPLLEIFYACEAKEFQDITGLNNLLHLRDLDLRETSILEAPQGCLALEVFEAFGAKELRNIRGLSFLPELEAVNVLNTAVGSPPINCPKLVDYQGPEEIRLRRKKAREDDPMLWV